MWRGLRARAASERGAGILMAAAAMVLLTSIGATVGTSAFRGLSSTGTDMTNKRAFAVAEAGLENALNRAGAAEIDEDDECLQLNAADQLVRAGAGANGWCTAVSGKTEDGGQYTYWQKKPRELVTAEGQTVVRVEIVSAGTYLNSSRRVYGYADTPSPSDVFAGKAVRSLDDLKLEDDALVDGSVASNAKIEIKKDARVCSSTGGGDATAGPGGELKLDSGASVCGSTGVAETKFGLPQVILGSVATDNDNGRIHCGSSPKPNPCDSATGAITWDPVKRKLTVNTDATLTLTGGTYAFCEVVIEKNAELAISPSATTEIFFLPPDNVSCPGTSNIQLELRDYARMRNLTGDPSRMRVLFAGKPGAADSGDVEGGTGSDSKVHLHKFSEFQDGILYGPHTRFDLKEDSKVYGAVAGTKITLAKRAAVYWDSLVDNASLPVGVDYQRGTFLECAKAAGATPSAGC